MPSSTLKSLQYHLLRRTPCYQVSHVQEQSRMPSSLRKPVLLAFSCPGAHQSIILRRPHLTNSMSSTVYQVCFIVASALFLLLCFTTSCTGGSYEDCYWGSCGSFQFSYPFGKINSGCGDPQFQLNCSLKSYPSLNINGEEYVILQLPYLANNPLINNSMTIINYNLWKSMPGGNCNPLCNYSQFWCPDSQYRIAHGYTNLTLWGQCNESIKGHKRSLCGADWYVIPNPESGKRFCQSNIQLPVSNNFSFQRNEDLRTQLSAGFEITWYADTKRNRSCGACLNSGGSCGYNISEPTNSLCYCVDGTSHTERCPTIRIGHKSRLHAIVIGCVIGGVASITIAVFMFLKFYAKKRTPTPGTSPSRVEKFLKENAYEMPMPTRYSHSDLKKITNNFAEKLGEGGFGVVYKGMLKNGGLVAVKLLDRHRHTENQFINEVATIGRVHHVNLVRLLGYCFENPISALVYEYMLNGSLDKFLFAQKEAEGQVLRWEQLYSIALGAARGIAYLHHDCDKCIVHFDIKPHNILLDADFTPKIADFGLAKLCRKGEDHISITTTRGTPGYVAPELFHSDAGPVTDKSDVYSFGMLLLEIVGGRKNIDVQVSRSSQFYFPEWAFKLLESGELGMRLRGEEMECADEEKATRLTKVGLWCIQYNSADRPCMTRVVQMLEANGDDVANPPLPFNSSPTPENPLLHSTVNSSSMEITF